MEINYWKEKEGKANMHGIDAREVYHHEHAQIMHLMIEPGKTVKSHKTPVDVIFVVLQGTAEFHIGDETQTATKEAIIHSPANIPHSIDNNENEVVRLLVIKTPNPKNIGF